MKKFLTLTTLFVLTFFIVMSCKKEPNNEPPPVVVTGVELSDTIATRVVGDNLVLTATVFPDSATNKIVTWTSSDTTVAKVNEGIVTTLKVGTANIIVTTQDGNKTATCALTVVAAAIPVTHVTLNTAIDTLVVGNTLNLTATVFPEDATNKAVTWSSSNTDVATVNATGRVSAVSAGAATITVTTQDGDKTATCEVAVIVIPVESVTLNHTEFTMGRHGSLPLTATVLPNNATNKAVTWSSSEPSVATVAADGRVTAVAEGEAIITVTTQDGDKTATCTITVIVPLINLSLNLTSAFLPIDSSFTLNPIFQPHDATNKNITWSSSNSAVATVVDGLVTMVSAGTATITVRSEDGTRSATCVVRDINPNRCNNDTPGWGASLGTVTRGTQEWTISGNSINQIWSDGVTATVCQKTTFSAGATGTGGPNSPANNFNADCRSNPDLPGDLWTWCALARFGDELCPAPWRVPTQQDFIDLTIALGGTGNDGVNVDLRDKLIATSGDPGQFWGSAYVGYCSTNGGLSSQGVWAYYWAITEIPTLFPRNADGLGFGTNGSVRPRFSDSKNQGFGLRCVK
jgi:uncharacterized protein (TIGR02145 family)